MFSYSPVKITGEITFSLPNGGWVIKTDEDELLTLRKLFSKFTNKRVTIEIRPVKED